MIAPEERAGLVAAARLAYRAAWPDDETVPETHACLYHAVSLQLVLARLTGTRAMLQAGSAGWPMCAVDDGERATHFSYVWDPHSAVTEARLAHGMLPEMHVWLALTPAGGGAEAPTLVDPTTRSWPARAALAGFAWDGPRPPDFLWHTQDEFGALRADYPLGVVYEASLDACRVADELAGREIYPKVAEILNVLVGRAPRPSA